MNWEATEPIYAPQADVWIPQVRVLCENSKADPSWVYTDTGKICDTYAKAMANAEECARNWNK